MSIFYYYISRLSSLLVKSHGILINYKENTFVLEEAEGRCYNVTELLTAQKEGKQKMRKLFGRKRNEYDAYEDNIEEQEFDQWEDVEDSEYEEEAEYEEDFEGEEEAEYEEKFEDEEEAEYEGDFEGEEEAEYEGDFEDEEEAEYEGEFEDEEEAEYEGDFEGEEEMEYEGDFEGEEEAEYEDDFDGEADEEDAPEYAWDAESRENADAEYIEKADYDVDAKYAESTEYDADAEYAENTEYDADAEYAEDTGYDADTEYTENAEYDPDAEYEEYSGYEENALYQDDMLYDEDTEYAEYEEYPEDDIYDDEEEQGIIPFAGRKNRSNRSDGEGYTSRTGKRSFFDKFRGMNTFDKVITGTGVAVLVMALVAGSIYAGSRAVDKQVSGFAGVGKELSSITLPGESGLLAVSDAVAAKKAAASLVEEEEKRRQEEEQQDNKSYEENDYNKEVEVSLELSSIKKDLKIKFINKKTGKLISNVPFEVSVKNAKGKASTWTDEDKDGIIYKTEITPGKYTVSVSALTDEKYKDYKLPAAASVEVKKDIEYKQVDVKNEIKSESEVNVKKEDTKINETKVESKLTNTVEWVDSTATTVDYKEIDKSTITDPGATAYAGTFLRLAKAGQISESTRQLKVGESFTLTASEEGKPLSSVTWSSSNTAVASVDSNGKVTALAKGTAVISFTAKSVSTGDASEVRGSCSVTVVEENTRGTLTVDKTTLTMAMGSTETLKGTVSGFTAGKELVYAASTNKAEVATVTADGNGNIAIKAVAAGEAVITVTANYKEGGTEETKATATISVKVAGNLAITLDKTTALVYAGTPIVINATVTNALKEVTVTAESSDTTIATVAVNQKAVTITGLKAGSANITVKVTENGVEAKAVCAVTVKLDPKQDKTTKLKDVKGNQIYVFENNQYREAVSADYYTATKFYIKGDAKYTGWQTLDGKVYYFDANGNKVKGTQVIDGARYNFSQEDGVLITGSGTRGIDVSKWNGNIDWKAVKNSGIEYVIIRSGYRGSSKGALIEDPKYRTNIKGASEAGLKVGVYFFTQAVSESEAVEEASMVLEQIKGYKISYPIFLDVEASGGRGDKVDKTTRTAVCKAFCQTIQNAGYTAGIYANKTWLSEKMDAGSLNSYKIWLAQYAEKPTYSGKYELWQYQSKGRVTGISGNVDMNWSYLGY